MFCHESCLAVTNNVYSLILRSFVKILAAILACLWAFVILPAADGQKIDTLISWNDYSRISSCRLTVFENPDDEKRPTVAVLSEIAENAGSPAIQDARFVVQRVGRQFNIDPAKAYWVFRWSAQSFLSPAESDKEVLFQATFRWSKQKTLTGPSWRIIDRDKLLELTDRRWTTPDSQ